MHQQEKMYHIGLSKEDIGGAQYAILPGDPGRVEKIAKLMSNPRKIGQNREYTSYLADNDGIPVLVMSTGMGGPSTAIAVEELHMLGLTHLIRVGTCGGMQLQVNPGDLVVVHGAIRQEGTSKEYLPVEFPAIADLDITLALRQAAKEQGFASHTGIVQCKDSFYGQHAPDRMDKKLYKDRSHQMLCGVCAGFANYLNMDVTVVRLLTVLLAFTQVGILFYIIAAIVMPDPPQQ